MINWAVATALAIAGARKVHSAGLSQKIISISTSISTILAALSIVVVRYRDWRTKKAFMHSGGQKYALINKRHVGFLGNVTEKDAEVISNTNGNHPPTVPLGFLGNVTEKEAEVISNTNSNHHQQILSLFQSQIESR